MSPLAAEEHCSTDVDDCLGKEPAVIRVSGSCAAVALVLALLLFPSWGQCQQTAPGPAIDEEAESLDSQPPSDDPVIQDGPESMEEAAGLMQETIRDLWAGFVAQSPLIFAGIVVLLLTAVVAQLMRWLVRKVFSRSSFRRSMKELLEQLTFVAVWILGLLIALVLMFPNMTPTKALGGLGILSLAVGFAFKDIFENFFAGILMLWRFPFEPGDFIECEGITGRVEDTTIRMTLIRKVTDELVIVPNSFLFTNPVDVLTNLPERRMTIVVGVAYSVPIHEAVRTIARAVRGCATVSQAQEIQVFPMQFGESSIDIEVAWWCESTPLGQRRSRGEVVAAIKQSLDAAGLEIPFPYRTLTFKEPLRVEQAGGMAGGS